MEEAAIQVKKHRKDIPIPELFCNQYATNQHPVIKGYLLKGASLLPCILCGLEYIFVHDGLRSRKDD